KVVEWNSGEATPRGVPADSVRSSYARAAQRAVATEDRGRGRLYAALARTTDRRVSLATVNGSETRHRGIRVAMVSALAIVGLALNLSGAISVARSRLVITNATTLPSAGERIYGARGIPASVSGSVGVERDRGWWLGWIAIIVGDPLQIAAVAW